MAQHDDATEKNMIDPMADPEQSAQPQTAQEEASQPPAPNRDEQSTPTPKVPPRPKRSRSGGFLGTVIGGVLAACIGFGAAVYFLPDGLSALRQDDQTTALASSLAAQDDRITALTDRVQTLSDRLASLDIVAEIDPKLADLRSDMQAGLSDFDGKINALSGEIGSVNSRLTAVEKRPVAAIEDISGSVAAYERELQALRDALAEQRQQNAQIAARISDAADGATAEIRAAVEQAQVLEQRTAMLRVSAALETGAPYAAALQSLDAQDIPAALTDHAAVGVPSLAQLRDSFAEYARQALTESLRAAPGDQPGGKLTNFLRAQVGARSLVPREGNDPDAILSRAEAALAVGDLATSLDEISSLPAEGQAAMADWVEQARIRRDASDALAAFAARLNLN